MRREPCVMHIFPSCLMFIARFALQIEHSEHAPRTAASSAEELSSCMQVIHTYKGTALPGSAGASMDRCSLLLLRLASSY